MNQRSRYRFWWRLAPNRKPFSLDLELLLSLRCYMYNLWATKKRIRRSLWEVSEDVKIWVYNEWWVILPSLDFIISSPSFMFSDYLRWAIWNTSFIKCKAREPLWEPSVRRPVFGGQRAIYYTTFAGPHYLFSSAHIASSGSLRHRVEISSPNREWRRSSLS